jgi:succinyl-diaminopimelate desuccinylase
MRQQISEICLSDFYLDNVCDYNTESSLGRDSLNYLKHLVRFRSVTPNHDGSMDYVKNLLEGFGFEVLIKSFNSDGYEVTNLYASYGPSKAKFCFVGHLDVVPTGDLSLWNSDPFELFESEGIIYGRGVVDMKGAVAAFIAAVLHSIKKGDMADFGVAILLTSDEEGSGVDGVPKMIEYIYSIGYGFEFALTGEPTCEEKLGDTIKIGRRGSLNFSLDIIGEQGHVAYPEKAKNPNRFLVKTLNLLLDTPLDYGNSIFSPSNLEITSIDVNNAINNVIPSKASARFNVRFNNINTAKSIAEKIENCIKSALKEQDVVYELRYYESSNCFIQEIEPLFKLCAKVIENYVGVKPKFSTDGGTSDARFVKNYCPVIEFGLLSHTAHKIDEHTAISDLQKLSSVYYLLLENLMRVWRNWQTH